MVAVPTAFASTSPVSESTAATDGAVELHVTALLVASSGFTVRVKAFVPPTPRVKVAGVTVTEVTGISGVSGPFGPSQPAKTNPAAAITAAILKKNLFIVLLLAVEYSGQA
jgi:hypothetical protein